MFTGIIEATGVLHTSERHGEGLRLCFRSGGLELADVAPGDSIAVNGVCLTAVELPGDGFCAHVSDETLRRTTLGELKAGAPVNLEKALRADGRFGGHLVSGHVDGIGEIRRRETTGRFTRFQVRAPRELGRYIAEKGSICVDGVSLTVNAVEGSEFALTIVPHTLQATIMDQYQAGTRVNLEVDLVARYLERLLRAGEEGPEGGGLSREWLARYGFLDGPDK